MAGFPPTGYPNFGTTNITPPNPFPTSLAATSGTWSSGVIVNYGLPAIVAAATSTQSGGVIELQRYADLSGTIPVGTLTSAQISQAFTANAPAWVGVNDGLPYLSYQITITNTAGSAATISGCAILTGPR